MGIVVPGTGSHSPFFQSFTTPCALPSPRGCRAAAARPRGPCGCRGAPWPAGRTFRRCTWKMSQSVLVCQGGAIAGLNEWMKGCMSVVEMSCFSYQVAAGSTTSLRIVELVIRKSRVISRSSFPSAASSRHTMSRGRLSGGASSAVADESVPSRCEEVLVALAASRTGSSATWTAPRLVLLVLGVLDTRTAAAGLQLAATYAGTAWPDASASSARCRRLRSNVGYDGEPARSVPTAPAGRHHRPPGEDPGAGVEVVGAEGVVAVLAVFTYQ